MSRPFALLCGLLWVAGLLAFDVAVYARTDVLRREFDALVADAFASKIEPGVVDFEFGGAIEVRGARLMRPDDATRPYAVVESIRVRPDWWSLLALKPRIAEIEIVRPKLYVAWDDDGAFDMPSPLRPGGEPEAASGSVVPPRVTLRGLAFVFERSPFLSAPRVEAEAPGFAVTLEPEGSSRWLYRFAVTLRSRALGDLDAEGRFSPERFEMTLRRDGFAPSAELVDALKPGLGGFLRAARLDGPMRFGASVLPPVEDGGAPTFEAHVDFDGVAASAAAWPLRLDDLRGRVALVGKKLATEGITARFEGGMLSARGSFDPDRDPRLRVDGTLLGLGMTPEFGDRVATLPGPCPTIGEQIRQWDPRGTCDLVFSLEQKRLAGGAWDLIRPKIDVEFRGDASVAYAGGKKEGGERRGFHYRISDVRGVLRCTDLGMAVEGVTASAGRTHVEASGYIDYEFADDEAYDIDVLARDLVMDAKIAEALAGPGRELYESLDIEGRADLSIAVKRKKGEPPGPRVTIVATPRAARLAPRAFPLEVNDVHGEVEIGDDAIVIRTLQGRHRGGRLRIVEGFLGQGARASDFKFVVETEKFPFQEPLLDALAAPAPTVAAALRKLGPNGLATGKVSVEASAEREVEVRGYLEFERLALVSEDPPYRVTDGVGAIEIDPQRVRVAPGSKARFAGEPFAVEGTVGVDGALDLKIEGARVQATPRLWAELRPLSPRIAALGDEPLLGPVEVAARLKGSRGAFEASIEKLLVRDGVARLPRFGEPLRDVSAEIEIGGDGALKARNVRARLPWPADVAGAASRPTDDAPRAALFSCAEFVLEAAAADAPADAPAAFTATDVAVSDAPLGPWLFGVLPLSDALRTKLAGAELGGVAAFSVGAAIRGRDGLLLATPHLRVDGFALGARLKADRLELGGRKAGAATSPEGGLTAEARLVARGVTAFEVPLPRLEARFRAAHGGFTLDLVDGDLLGYAPPRVDEPADAPRAPYGRILDETSSVSYGFDDGQFNVALRVVDVDVAALVRWRGGDPGEVYGLLGGSLDLAGASGDESTYVGEVKAKANLRKAVDLPFFFQLFNRLDLLSFFQSANPPTKVGATFEVRDRLLTSKDVEVNARDVVLRGPARIRFDGYVRADLAASYAAGILPWTWIMSALSSAVAPGVVIEGPLGATEIRIETPKPDTPLPPESRPAK